LKRQRVLITGARDPVARALVRRLHRDYQVSAVDAKEPRRMPADVHTAAVDLRRRALDHLMRRRRYDVVIHAGVMTDLRAGDAVHHAYNVVAVTRLLELCRQRGVRKVIILSSARLYGHRPANTVFLNEDAPLLAGERFSSLRDRVQMDLRACATAWREPGMEVVILRSVPAVGAGLNNGTQRYFARQRVPVILGFDPSVQLIHVEDLVSAIECLMEPGLRGPYNVAGPPPASLHRVLKELRRTAIPLPRMLLGPMLGPAWNLGLTRFRAEELDLIQYSCIVSDQRLRDATGFEPAFGLRQTVLSVDAPF
jgi:UDP-glucose 4-epimerase